MIQQILHSKRMILEVGSTEFMVGKESTTNAILETNGIEIDRLENIKADCKPFNSMTAIFLWILTV